MLALTTAAAVTALVLALGAIPEARSATPSPYLFAAWAENVTGGAHFVSRWFQSGDVARLTFLNGYAQPFSYQLCIERGKRKLVCWATRKVRPLAVDRISYSVDLPYGLNFARWYVAGRSVASWPIYVGGD